ncbi:MAG: glycine dehydrogenase subunit 2 [Rhodospirillaceae bacterium]|nr:MAG: glycine dehydrogenase subunit 2 [Rhodospirillaceae bacterium]
MDTNNASHHRGLMLEEPLVFELGAAGRTGVDLPEPEDPVEDRLGGMRRKTPIGLPGLSEPQVVRHYTRLSQKNYSIDTGFYPLGSCTMKHNPRLNEALARLPGFADIHPFQPVSTVQGALAVMAALVQWLKALTGMEAVALSPAAGAHGELTGLMTIRAALEAQGRARTTVLVPASAHGTNPATAALCGYRVQSVPAAADGRVPVAAVKERLDADTAAVMLTNPNTCGLFETDFQAIAEAVHGVGGFCYLDGANFNALVGRVRVADLGVDAMHINLHKTFSTPHGGGGPGAGPVVFSKALAPFMPVPFVRQGAEGFVLAEHPRGRAIKTPFGRIKGFHGSFGVWVRALAYMLSMGIDGLRQASGDAVLNANYLRARLQDDLTLSFPGLCMHEVLFDDRFLKGTGVTTLDFAKALIDAGFHPMTIYFPLIVHGALLVEPTETESRETLDQFIDTVKALAARARAGEEAFFHAAPRHTPRRRLDETAAARYPRLRWRPRNHTNGLKE